jgi:hypothetical protein
VHCFYVPVLVVPWHVPKGPLPNNYPAFLSDAVLIASLQSMAKNVTDTKVREAEEKGISAGLAAIQHHIGSEVTIRQVAAN